jgi:outer membrane biosynthesis protein TonB
MILEEFIGDVVATVVRENGEATILALGDYFSEHERSSLSVTGNGKIVVRVDANCTVEIRGVEPVVEETPVKKPVPVVKPTKPVEPVKTVEPTKETPEA